MCGFFDFARVFGVTLAMELFTYELAERTFPGRAKETHVIAKVNPLAWRGALAGRNTVDCMLGSPERFVTCEAALNVDLGNSKSALWEYFAVDNIAWVDGCMYAGKRSLYDREGLIKHWWN
jgi:hypothetical protein